MRHLALIKEVTEGTWKKRKLTESERCALLNEGLRLLKRACELLDETEKRLDERLKNEKAEAKGKDQD